MNISQYIPEILSFLAALFGGVALGRWAKRSKAQDLYDQMAEAMGKQQVEINILRAQVTEYVEKMNKMLIENGKLELEVQRLTLVNKDLKAQIDRLQTEFERFDEEHE